MKPGEPRPGPGGRRGAGNSWLVVVLAGLFLPALTAPAGGAQTFQPVVVVAIIDTAINPWHEEFRERAFGGEPATYIAGFPAGAVPVALTLDAGTFQEAFDADKQNLLNTIQKGTFVTFPGTKIVGALSLDPWDARRPLLVPVPGLDPHGVRMSSRLAGNTVSLAGPEVRLVFVQGVRNDADREAAVRWAAAQPWIDIISVSFGSFFAKVCVDDVCLDGNFRNAPHLRSAAGTLADAFEEASHTKPFFASAGNGLTEVPGTQGSVGGITGFPTWLRGVSGAPDAISVGANDNGRLTTWANWDPYVVADGCANPAATHDSLAELRNVASGTSSATPFAAGGAARIVFEARRILGDAGVGPRDGAPGAPGTFDSGFPGDRTKVLAEGPAGLVAQGPIADGVLTVLDLKDLLYHTALETGTEDGSDGNACDLGKFGGVPGTENVPTAAGSTFSGFGEVNGLSLARALAVLGGEQALPFRPVDDAHYLRAHALRNLTWSLPPPDV